MGLNEKMKTIIAVPARLNSSRLPKKVLADIGGKPMLIRVLEQCKKINFESKIVLCTDSEELSQLAQTIDIKSIITSEDCKSGSERIASVAKDLVEIAWDKESVSVDNQPNFYFKKKNTLIINVQGDQPFLEPNVINEMNCFFENQKEIPAVVTPIYKLKKESIHNPSVVKTLINNKGEAIYFSRSAIPFIRDKEKDLWFLHYDYWGHVGIYGYRADILLNWDKYPLSDLEQSEKLEQLRIIDAGINIKTYKVEGNFLSIDNEDQLIMARNIAKNFRKY